MSVVGLIGTTGACELPHQHCSEAIWLRLVFPSRVPASNSMTCMLTDNLQAPIPTSLSVWIEICWEPRWADACQARMSLRRCVIGRKLSPASCAVWIPSLTMVVVDRVWSILGRDALHLG